LYPRDCNKVAIEAEAIPLPSDETTPPVTKIKRTMEVNYRLFINNHKENIKLNYFEFGIFGCVLLFLSNCSILSIIDF
jgi:hypothetical protein